MLAEERIGTAVGEVGIGLVVMLAAFSRERVVHFRICVNGDERVAF